ncbi:uncharacterized protein LOC126400252 [Epinephelus moara]|uniref:uncharacterized protein LOC126400252 n=1 Tax=Epinephelus moara TaxID=300413 RepID=UPI00214E88C8|nr:uncharacterized protein LOC126400252 [Epinephelus moara]
MWGMKHLLILSVFVLLARCQQKPQVTVLPTLKKIFSGDLIFLSCDNGGSSVKWYFKGQEQQQTNKNWKIGVASPKHSGSYQCESNGQKSDIFPIDVLDHVPTASLTIKIGQPVVQTGGSVVLQLDNEDGLQGWKCWVYRGKGPEGTKRIALRLKNDSENVVFQTKRLEIPETVFWCSDNEQRRSNQVIVRTSDKEISLEMYPLPAVVGESLSLRCLAWGTDQISSTVFYKNNAVLLESHSPTLEISKVTESESGSYRCNAIFTHKAHTDGPPSNVMSDDQDVFVQVPPMRAVLSANTGMSCSCPQCPSDSSYRWYYKKSVEPWARMDSDKDNMMPKEGGTYACRAVWASGRSLLSNSHVHQPMITFILIGVITVLVILCLVVVLIYIYYKKRNTTGPIYEDMPLRSRDKGDDQYEGLQRGAQREGEYDTLNPEAPGREKKEGQYEALKKEGMTSGEYDTVRMEGAVGGESGYEALKREGMKEGVYHTLGMEGAEGGGKEGGYEALKREGMKEGVYHTLGMEGAAGSE